jgi:hypothetical protein
MNQASREGEEGMKDNRKLESELRASRSQPRADFATGLADEVRGATARARQSRIGLRLAVAGLVIVAVASFGGISYASSSEPSAAEQQYGEFTPPATTTTTTTTTTTPTETTAPAATVTTATTPEPNVFTPPAAKATAKKAGVKPKKVVRRAKVSGKAQAGNVAPATTHAQLPFTGLALWVPLAFGLVLIAVGLVLRTRGRRRSSGAH